MRITPALELGSMAVDRLLQLCLVECDCVAQACKESARVLQARAVGRFVERALPVLREIAAQLLDLSLFGRELRRARGEPLSGLVLAHRRDLGNRLETSRLAHFAPSRRAAGNSAWSSAMLCAN